MRAAKVRFDPVKFPEKNPLLPADRMLFVDERILVTREVSGEWHIRRLQKWEKPPDIVGYYDDVPAEVLEDVKVILERRDRVNTVLSHFFPRPTLVPRTTPPE